MDPSYITQGILSNHWPQLWKISHHLLTHYRTTHSFMPNSTKKVMQQSSVLHSYLHAERGADEVVDGRHLVAMKVNCYQQQHSSERRADSTHSTRHNTHAAASTLTPHFLVDTQAL